MDFRYRSVRNQCNLSLGSFSDAQLKRFIYLANLHDFQTMSLQLSFQPATKSLFYLGFSFSSCRIVPTKQHVST